MKKNKGLIIIIGLIIVLGLFSVTKYNGLVNSEEKVELSYANVQSQLQMRFDKINQLVAAVDTSLSHESEVFKAVAALRSDTPGVYTDANGNIQIDPDLTINEMEAIENRLTEITTQINIAQEAYPDLKANQNVTALMDEISSTESQLNLARRDYNQAVSTYNTSLRKFPNNIFASMFNFDRKEPFKASEDAQNAPNKLGD